MSLIGKNETPSIVVTYGCNSQQYVESMLYTGTKREWNHYCVLMDHN